MQSGLNNSLFIMLHEMPQIKPPLIGAGTEKAEALKKENHSHNK